MTKATQLHKTPKRPRARKCLSCREWFNPTDQGITTCSVSCAIAYGKTNVTKQNNKIRRKAKIEHNKTDTKSLLASTQKIFNQYIRKRDQHLPCVSCGYVFTYLYGEPMLNGRQRQAGHLRTEAKNASLRFNEDNVHAQCNYCNDPYYGLKGNIGEYERLLRDRIGDARVDEVMNSPKEIKKWTTKELRDIKSKYIKKLRGLE